MAGTVPGEHPLRRHGNRGRHRVSPNFIEQEDPSAALIGFTITGGTGTVWTDARDKTLFREGGGILCELSSPRIEHNIIEGSEAVKSPGTKAAPASAVRGSGWSDG
ncbi:MAG: hypothetical protein ACREL3_09160 [Gemmatimonadales bacterium]